MTTDGPVTPGVRDRGVAVGVARLPMAAVAVGRSAVPGATAPPEPAMPPAETGTPPPAADAPPEPITPPAGDAAGTRRGAAGALAYAEVLVATMAVTTAGLLYGRFFTTRGYLLPLIGAALCAALLAGFAAVRRVPKTLTGLIAVLGFALFTTSAVLTGTLAHGVPTLRTATALGEGVVRGWARLLTVGLPADVTPELLFTPVLLAWAASFVTTTLVLRTRSALVPLAPVLAFIVALVVIAPRAGGNLILTGVFLLLILVAAAIRVVRLDLNDLAGDPAVTGPSPGPRRILGRLTFAGPVVLVVTAIGTGVPAVLPVADGADRFDVRTVVPLRIAIDDTLTPLVTLKSQLRTQPPRTLFTVRVDDDAGTRLDRIRTAALDNYDGALWSSRDSYLVAGHDLTGDPALRQARRITAHLSIRDLPGPYVPVIGWPVRVTGGGFGFSATSGVLVSQSSLHGRNYDVVGEMRPPDAGLSSALPATGAEAAQDTQLAPGLPAEIQQKSAELTAQVREPYAKLTAIESYLRKLPYSLDARPGHSYDALRRLFSSNPQDRVGYAEQYATAFAVLARSQGFPARVAVGYRLRPEERKGTTYTVTTADAHAWPEVDLAGYGWVPFEPTNVSVTPSSQQVPPSAQPGEEEKPADAQSSGTQAIVDPNLQHGAGLRARLVAGGLVALAVLGILLVVTPLLVAAEKYRRRRRRRRGSNARRIVGAWHESTDRLVERGVAVPRSLTPWEVAVRAEQHLGEPAQAVGVLAPLVTAAIFAPIQPGDDTVREAWELDARLRRELRRRGLLRAVRAKVDPRPLVEGWRDRRRRRTALNHLHGG